MKIYTRTGDDGTTGLFGGQRVEKDSPRVQAYGEVDETNAAVGVARAALQDDDPLQERFDLIQSELFIVGADLATPLIEGKASSSYVPRLEASQWQRMEQWIDEAEQELEPLKTFILPGGTPAAAALHLARTICRRAERRVVTLSHSDAISPDISIYLNRLSDLLFTWARLVNARAGVKDIPWLSPKE
jgi:cob(I)alamin adenosyltransferase